MEKNSVVFKGKKDGILIILDDKVSFTELKETLSIKVKEAKGFFKGAKAAITFKGRELTEEEELELLDIISKSSGLNISFVNISESSNSDNNIKPFITAKENITTFHNGSVRSGQIIRFPGSIVVIGNVHPGGEIIAEGNIVILGTLSGIAHAGCSGSADCFVAAINMKPAQLRIANLITFFSYDKVKKKDPEYAYAKDGQIYIKSLIHIEKLKI